MKTILYLILISAGGIMVGYGYREDDAMIVALGAFFAAWSAVLRADLVAK